VIFHSYVKLPEGNHSETQNSQISHPEPRSTASEQQRLAEKANSGGSCSKQGLCIGEVQHKTCVALGLGWVENDCFWLKAKHITIC